MITAKDIFTLEREMLEELKYAAHKAGLTSEEREIIFYNLDGITEQEYNELLKQLADRELNPLEKIKNGEALKASEVNQAVRAAANRD